MLVRLGARHDDVRYIDLYSEFEAMKGRGEKTTYAVLYLAENTRCASARYMML